jgi:hypothetical protein
MKRNDMISKMAEDLRRVDNDHFTSFEKVDRVLKTLEKYIQFNWEPDEKEWKFQPYIAHENCSADRELERILANSQLKEDDL